MSQSKQSDTPSNPVDLNTSTEPAATAVNPVKNDEEELSEDQLAGVAGGRPKRSATTTNSDLRLKHDIEALTVVGDIALYRFKYIDDDSQTDWVGVMAQDLLESPQYQSAVSTSASGYYQVDYQAIGLEMVRYDEWLKQTRH